METLELLILSPVGFLNICVNNGAVGYRQTVTVSSVGMCSQTVNLASRGFDFHPSPHRGNMSKAGQFPLGKSEKLNVALQRPTVNLRESENVGEQVAAVTHQGGQNPFPKSGSGWGGHVHNLWDRE